MEFDPNRGQFPATKSTSPAHAVRRPYVLVVDDDQAHRRLMDLVAEFLQVHITSMHCAEEALKLLHHTDAFELILLDCRMPEVDGFTFAERYRELETSSKRKRVPIIAVTGMCDEATALRCREVGMDDCLFKPFELMELKNKIQMFLSPSAPIEFESKSESCQVMPQSLD